jgi:hypothetical protein
MKRSKGVKVGDEVIVIADHERNGQAYASAGDSGMVVETFKVSPNARPDNRIWHAKVRIGAYVKTFRQTSLARK